MIQGYSSFVQALLGTLFTWGVTALGAGLVFFLPSVNRKIYDGSLGFAAGVMVAASFWSLLAPAIEMAEASGFYGSEGQYAWIPACVGFLAGALFVHYADRMLAIMGVSSTISMLTPASKKDESLNGSLSSSGQAEGVLISGIPEPESTLTYRGGPRPAADSGDMSHDNRSGLQGSTSWRRILLLIIAITVHNIPEGLAVGVGFGAVGKTPAASFEKARNLAIGIGLQNFPEGLAVSLPLRGYGYSKWQAFWWGQLSGLVEPIAGVLGVLTVSIAEPILPYALTFAAGAMIFVVADDLIPEASSGGNSKLATWGCIVGFLVMMAMDVGLG